MTTGLNFSSCNRFVFNFLKLYVPEIGTIRNIISNKNLKLNIKTTLGTVREIVLFYSLFIKAVEMSHVNNSFSSTVIKEMSHMIIFC